MNYDYYSAVIDNGPDPYVTNVWQLAVQNSNFRTTVWTGEHMQLTVMCIPVCQSIGLEQHKEIDQFIRVEAGEGIVKMGKSEDGADCQKCIYKGDGIFIPAETWHNIVNTGRCPLKLSVIYAPTEHPAGTVHNTKKDSDNAEH